MKQLATWLIMGGLIVCAARGADGQSWQQFEMVAGTSSAQEVPHNPPQPPATTQPVHQHPAAAPPTRPAQPILGLPPVEVHPEMIDLGVIRPNQKVSGTAYIQNVSDKWLKILASKADCSCTSVNLANTMLAPGQSVPLEAQLYTNVMGEWNGAIQVLIDGYDPITVKAKAMVSLPVRAEPAYIAALKTASGEKPVSGEFEVISSDGKPFSILSVNGDPPEFVNFDPKADQPRNAYRLKWDLSAFDERTCRDDQGRRLPGWIIVETDHPECPIFDLEVRHECNRRRIQRTDNWAIQEKRVFVGGMQPGESIEVEIVAKWIPRTTERDAIKAVTPDSVLFKVELLETVTLDDGMRCRLRITPKADHRGLLTGAVRLHSSRQNASLPIIGTVR